MCSLSFFKGIVNTLHNSNSTFIGINLHLLADSKAHNCQVEDGLYFCSVCFLLGFPGFVYLTIG